MAKTIDPEQVPGMLAQHRDEAPADVQHYYLTIEDQWERKLWHELTETLLEYFRLPESGPQRLPLYNDFIKSFTEKINQLKLVALGLEAATQCPDDLARVNFLEQLAKQVDKPSSQDAYVSAQAAVAGIKLQRGDLEGAKKDLSQCEQILDTFDAVETTVHARFYSVNSDYYKAKQDFAAYYKNTLLYLACVDVAALPPAERQARAHDLAIAALLSDSIYNFGELLQHPILGALRDTPHAWLADLLFAFNRGDLRAYEAHRARVAQTPPLDAHAPFLHQKISLAALSEAAFRRPPHDRAMPFAAIRDETAVPLAEIEHLLMKALSLGLLRGSIDQVAQVADIRWVQPKVLDMAQIEGMRARLGDWNASVHGLGTWIESVGKDVWAA